MVTIYSPISHKRSQWLRIPVINDDYEVADGDGKMVSIQVIPINPITRALWLANAYNTSLTRARYEVVFRAELPPLGWNTYYFKRFQDLPVYHSGSLPREVPLGVNGELVIENDAVVLSFDTQTGQLARVNQKQLGFTMPFEQSLRYYLPWQGPGPKSGAYAFRPINSTTYQMPILKLAYVKGSLVSEVYQQFGTWAGQVIRLYRDSEYFEIEWTVGPIDFSDGYGKEIISLYRTNISNGKVFWGDLNGRQLLWRKLDYRPTWDYHPTEPIAGNYYPFPVEMNIQDSNLGIQLTIFTDRCQGGTSIQSGSMELMLHRRLIVDDGAGMDEPLNETGVSGNGLVARGVHYVLLHTIAHSAQVHREIGNSLVYFSVPTFSSPDTSVGRLASAHALQKYWQQNLTLVPNWSGLQADLPTNIQITTLQQWDEGTLLLRLAHLFGPNEQSTEAKNETIDLQKIFSTIKVLSYEELTLGANMLRSEWLQQQIKWNVKFFSNSLSNPSDMESKLKEEKKLSSMDVIIQPSEIRTFLLHIA